ncbi:MAG: GIY-YIG nuclease family protein [Gemmatimonadales bacterium]
MFDERLSQAFTFNSMARTYFVYILASESRQRYVGVTNDLERRLAEHKAGLSGGYAHERDIKRLVHFEVTTDIRAAISRERQVKAWTRAKRLALIEKTNPEWRDLANS